MNLAVALLISLGLLAPSSQFGSTSSSSDVQLLVKFKDGTSTSVVNSESQRHGRVAGRLALGEVVLKVPSGKQKQAIDSLSRSKNVEYVEEDVLAHAVLTPNDTLFAANQWGLSNTGQAIVGQAGTPDADIDATEAWDITVGTGVKVAVLDTGVDQDHPDLSSKIVANRNFTTSPTVDDIYGHGTHVAGTIAAVTDNSTGVAGGCPGCVVLNGKVLRDDGAGYISWISNGIIWAADNGAKVINLSLGTGSSSMTLKNAVNYAWNHGALVVAAAGNSGSAAKLYPAAYPNAIAVAATDNRDAKASFSNYGAKWVDLAAPGVNVYATFPNHAFTLQQYGRSLNYDFASGTSMATPMVAAAAALTWGSSYGTSASSVRIRLEATADDIAGTGKYWSAGRVNASHAVTP